MSFDKTNPKRKHTDGPSEIPKDKLILFINDGLSSGKIAKILGRSQCSVAYWLKKHNLKTKFQYREGGWKKHQDNTIENTDWPDIQSFYDNNHSWRDVRIEYNISQHTIIKALKLNLLKSRPDKETHKLKYKINKHTPETKAKLSIARKLYLSKNSDKPAWKAVNKNISIPCEKLKQKLIELKINFTEEFQPLLHLKRFFSIDIAFPEHKIGIEINGGQHYDTNGSLKPYYQDRHDLICSNGWKLYEIPYHKAFNLNLILQILIDNNLYQNGASAPI